MIFITAKREGFARCGVRFSETTTSYPDDRFTPEQLADLEAEPMLVVSREGAGMTAGQAAEQISRLKDALDTAEHEMAVVTAERDVLHQQLADMTTERDALREQLAAVTSTPAANAQDETAPGDTDENDADAEAKPDAGDAPKATRTKKK
ncbi:HI1506-related protein [Salmonella enterica]